jgi:periplasmic protein TonB
VSDKRKNLMLALGLAVLVILMGLGIYQLMSGQSGPPKKPPKISLIPSTPPPPPPPPKEEPKPEPPKEIKEVKEIPQAPPKDAPPAPPSQELKMDGPAGDGPSAFSAGKITSEDISKIGQGGAGGGEPEPAKGLFNPFTSYGTLLKGEMQRYLARNKDLRQRAYKVQVRVWVDASGHVTRHELADSTGDAELDEAIRTALGAMPAVSDPPPANMPMPIRLRLSAVGRG